MTDLRDSNVCRVCAKKDEEIEELKGQIKELQRKLEMTESTIDAAKMVKRLRRTLTDLQSKGAVENVIPCGKVDIGGGVLVEQSTLDRHSKLCNGSATKYARALLRCVFSPDELKGKSIYGQGSNAHRHVPAKEALDPTRLEAVLGHTHGKFPGISDTQLKSSLSSLLCRELK
ncbi:uncharacterized protein LOC135371451 [Ornithodoros turicata]|uniref:uncharacterized protein LOC135371451 n=1 Tax=Ornithodoros turicata TaxID=34597 RepID=UPI003138F841